MTEGTRNCSYPFSSYDDPEVVGVSAAYKFRYERGTFALIGAEVTAGPESIGIMEVWRPRAGRGLRE
jgi:hypothetical protein